MLDGNEGQGKRDAQRVYPRALVDRLLTVADGAGSASLAMDAARAGASFDPASDPDGLVRGLGPAVGLLDVLRAPLARALANVGPETDRAGLAMDLWDVARRARLLIDLVEHLGPLVHREAWDDHTETPGGEVNPDPADVEAVAAVLAPAPVDGERIARVTGWTDKALVEVERFAIENEEGPLAVACLRWRNGLAKGWATDASWAAVNGVAIITELCNEAVRCDDGTKDLRAEDRIDGLRWSIEQIKAVAELTGEVGGQAGLRGGAK